MGIVRKRFLIRALVKLAEGQLEIERVTELLGVLSGIYEQAARTAEGRSLLRPMMRLFE